MHDWTAMSCRIVVSIRIVFSEHISCTLDTSGLCQNYTSYVEYFNPTLMLGKLNIEKLHMYNGAADKLTNWIFLMGKHLNMIGVTSGNICAKFAVTLEGKRTNMIVQV